MTPTTLAIALAALLLLAAPAAADPPQALQVNAEPADAMSCVSRVQQYPFVAIDPGECLRGVE